MPVSRRGWPNCWRPCSSLPLRLHLAVFTTAGHWQLSGHSSAGAAGLGPRVTWLRPSPPNPNSVRRWRVTCADVATRDDLTARQVEIIKTLQRHGGELWLSDALQALQNHQRHPETSGHRRLPGGRTAGSIAHRPQPRPDCRPTQGPDPRPGYRPGGNSNPDPGQCRFCCTGVTGSGKTEVYLQAIAPCLKAGQSVRGAGARNWPHPPAHRRFTRRFGGRVCIYHSALFGRRTV